MDAFRACDGNHSFYSFILISKNEEKNIALSLDSILALNIESSCYEIILIDNGSIDNTANIARNKGACVYVQSSLSVGGMRNFGANAAKGDILIFLDADVVISVDWFNSLSSHLLDNRANCTFAPEAWFYSPTLIERVWLQLKGLGEQSVKQVRWCQSGAFMIKKLTFNEIGGFDESLGTSEDYDFGIRLSSKHKILRDGSVSFQHLRTPKTLKDLFWQQVWHGKGSYASFFNRKFSVFELVSTFLPFVFVISICLFGLLVLFYTKVALICLLCAAVIYMIYLIRKIRRIDLLPIGSILILIFLIARGLALIINGRRLAKEQ